MGQVIERPAAVVFIGLSVGALLGANGLAAQTVGNEVTCRGCRIRAQTVAVLGTENGPAALDGQPRDIAVDSLGRYWLLYPHGPLVFDRSGRLIRAINRRGQGPGEYGNAVRLLALPGDSMLIMDQHHSRATVLGPDLQFVRTISLPMVQPWSVVTREWPAQVLFNGRADTPTNAGWMLHYVNFSANPARVTQSFWRANPTLTFAEKERLWFVFAADRQSTWLLNKYEYRISRLTREGEEIVLHRRPPWFPGKSTGLWGGPQIPPSPEMRAIGVDSAGLIWTAGVASRADWRAAWRDMPRLQPGETSWAPDEQMLLRTVVEVIDTRSRSLLSTTSLLGSARVFLDRNRLAVYTVQNDVPRVAIIELRLLQQDQ